MRVDGSELPHFAPHCIRCRKPWNLNIPLMPVVDADRWEPDCLCFVAVYQKPMAALGKALRDGLGVMR